MKSTVIGIWGWLITTPIIVSAAAPTTFGEYAAQTPSAQLSVQMVEPTPGSVRQAERSARDDAQMAHMDSLATARNFQFLPVSVYDIDGGATLTTLELYYYAAILPDHLQVHLPLPSGRLNTYPVMLDLNTPQMSDYHLESTYFGWNLSFKAVQNGVRYTFSMDYLLPHGQTILYLKTPGNLYRFVGSLAPNTPQLGTPPLNGQ